MVSKAQIKAVKKYEDKTYFKTLIRFHKSDEDKIRKAADVCNTSLNNFIVEAVNEKISRMNTEWCMQEKAPSR